MTVRKSRSHSVGSKNSVLSPSRILIAGLDLDREHAAALAEDAERERQRRERFARSIRLDFWAASQVRSPSAYVKITGV